MSTTAHTDTLAEAVTRIGARPFKAATGSWSTAVEIALLDTILSIGAITNEEYGAGVLPRLRAYKAFRGPANMLRVTATLGPFGLADFVPNQEQIQVVMTAAAALLDAGINTADDVDPQSDQQRSALLAVEGVPELGWDYLLVCLDQQNSETAQLKESWLEAFVNRALDTTTTQDQRETLLAEVTAKLDAEHQRKTFGHMPEFTLPQVHQAIFRSEYARATA